MTGKRVPLRVVVMAGGKGERFWPKSRAHMPKQFLRITGNKPMLVETVERLEGLATTGSIRVGTHESFSQKVFELLPDLPKSNLIPEPAPKDTAAAIALAALELENAVSPETVLFFLPSDHYIGDAAAFRKDASLAAQVAHQQKTLTLLGVKPSRPSESFGYLELKTNALFEPVPASLGKVFGVETFIEKPDVKTAEVYLRSGNHLWNAGMFFVRLDKLVSMLEQHIPGHVTRLRRYLSLRGNSPDQAREVFGSLEKISFDYAVAEREADICAVVAGFPWDDVGSWNALSRLKQVDSKKNLLSSNATAFECYNVLCDAGDGEVRVVLSGLSDLNVVLSGNVLYIAHKDSEGKIKDILKHLGDDLK